MINTVFKGILAYKQRIFVGILMLTIFNACVPTQKVRDVKSNVPDTFQNASSDTLSAAKMQWKDFFTDANLIALIDTALVNNQELNIMLQNINMAQNEVQVRKGEYLPFVNAYAGAEVEKVGKYTRNGAVEESLELDEAKFPEPLGNLAAGVNMSWELDVWKKLRNSKKAAMFEYLSSVEGKNFMVTNLVAEIADSYFELVALDNQLLVVDKTLEIQNNALEMVKLQKIAGRATQLAVKRFEAEVFKNQSHKYEIQQEIVEIENKVNFLVGRTPRPITRNSEGFTEATIDALQAGLPAQLLQNRPDIKMAEFELEAAKLDTKAAKANFYPSIGIQAGVGLEAFKPKFLTETPESLVYSLVGDIVGPLINRNAIKAEYNTANAKQLQAVYEYEKAVLNGYMEVSNQLSNYDNLKNNFAMKMGQVDALKESTKIAMMLFQSARVEYIEVLLTQREALEARMELIETRKAQLMARVNLYQALGGGWN